MIALPINFPKLSHHSLKKNKAIIGRLLGSTSHSDPTGQELTLYILHNEDENQVVGIWGTVALNAKMRHIKNGALVSIKFKGRKKFKFTKPIGARDSATIADWNVAFV